MMTAHAAGSIQSFVLEAFDWGFLVLLVFAFATTAHYMVRMTAIDIDNDRWAPWTWGIEVRAALSLAVVFFGLILRVGSHAILRHTANHGLHWEAVTSTGPVVVLISTVLTTLSIVYWIRTVVPLRCGVWSWTSAALLATALGVGMAVWP